MSPKPRTAGRAYVMNKKEAAVSSMTINGTLFLNSKPFYILFDLVAIHSFISTRAAIQLNLEKIKSGPTIELVCQMNK